MTTKKVDRRSGVIRLTLIVLIIFALVAIIGGTYARYSTEGKASAQATVAKWAVTIKNGDTTLSSESQNINFTITSNSNVVSNRIAPGGTATADVELDLTGTEVAVDFKAEVNQSSLSGITGLTLTPSIIDSATGEEVSGATIGNTLTIPLVNSSAFTASNGKRKVRLTLTWTDAEANNANDTAAGVAGSTLSIPVTLTAQQHIGN